MIASTSIQFDRHPAEFQPKETVSGTFHLVDVKLEELNRIEFSLLWFTEGKGDEDLGVHFFDSLDWTKGLKSPDSSSENFAGSSFVLPWKEDFTKKKIAQNAKKETIAREHASKEQCGAASEQNEGPSEPDQTKEVPTFRFAVTLPASPLSYYGKILKIYWCVRVRLFLKNGREVKSERVFVVGDVPAIQVDLN